MYICMCTYVNVCMYVYIYIHTCIYIVSVVSGLDAAGHGRSVCNSVSRRAQSNPDFDAHINDLSIRYHIISINIHT